MKVIVIVLALMLESGAEGYLQGVSWRYECVQVTPVAGNEYVQASCYQVVVE